MLERVYRLGAAAAHVPPHAWASRQGIEVLRDVPYGPRPDQRMDVYRPSTGSGPWPAVMYVHGGGFALLSKETHWMFAQAFAQRGHVVFNIDYRLAPAHPFPAGLEDVFTAYGWARRGAEAFGGDGRVIVAGESAGANLVLGLSLAACLPRPEPGASRVLRLGAPPDAVVGLCGLYQVSQIDRIDLSGWMAPIIRRRLVLLEGGYLPTTPPTSAPLGDAPSLADPLLALEAAVAHGPLPSAFPAVLLSVGTADPIAEDSRRLHDVLARAGSSVRLHEHPGQPHAFQAFWWRAPTRRAWAEIYEFLGELGL